MILLINVCSEPLHYLEFVKPIADLIKCKVIHYKDIKKRDLNKAEKVIICGTSLKDNKFLEDIKSFEWILNYEKPILGICAGMQIILLAFGGKLKAKKEIGFYFENFKLFFGIKGREQVYHLHTNFVTMPPEFMDYTYSKIPQAVKHRDKKIFGVLFHPEVRNKQIISNFSRLDSKKLN
jgi:GMP synthase-like glutamine amidotransferase